MFYPSINYLNSHLIFSQINYIPLYHKRNMIETFHLLNLKVYIKVNKLFMYSWCFDNHFSSIIIIIMDYFSQREIIKKSLQVIPIFFISD